MLCNTMILIIYLFKSSHTSWDKIASMKFTGVTSALLYTTFLFGFGVYNHILGQGSRCFYEILGMAGERHRPDQAGRPISTRAMSLS